MNEAARKSLLPVVPFVVIPASGDPFLEGKKCDHCGAVFVDRRTACARCFGRDCLSPHRLSETGTVCAFTIITRSFPGVRVPYVSVIVDLDGGGTIKGNLKGIEHDSGKIRVGLAVSVTYEEAPYGDKAGNSYQMYSFRPVGE
ncbi:MAG: OB-fold domain-containing protein [Gammaproteobacteria bacterium]|jgi:uncharacterized OB-fold protein|nr:OB-fold domain-containing protein [Gammaproteobacteria bacterium]MBP6053143.1 OB-fold domain-containing protein [Pseudomonadales bacterium]MBK6584554.1 OB-fold domain-containing protein [Gammaproteobacteria bacterium]MBK7169211.1 OB-fold domain-containing protein [Gammaproteobacteria bacterium]MBK7519941.1 OB-fold domain-containing protein [Gammaproteobacteria bacterium]